MPILITLLSLAAIAATLGIFPALRRATVQSLARGSFVAAIAVLGISAVGLNGATSFLQLHFKKLPVPMRVRSFIDSSEGIPRTLGPWIQVSQDEPVDPEVQQVLATDQYLFRDYVDSREWPDTDLASLPGQPAAERNAALQRYQALKPRSVMRVAMTYYTGMADTVAHIPERCYVADGYEVSKYETQTALCGQYPNGSPRSVSFRVIHFEDLTGHGRVARDVAYLFHVNGKYESDSLAVRRRLQSLSERYGYYAKVELMMTRPSDRGDSTDDQVRAAMVDFLGRALPAFENCLPDWDRLHGRRGE